MRLRSTAGRRAPLSLGLVLAAIVATGALAMVGPAAVASAMTATDSTPSAAASETSATSATAPGTSAAAPRTTAPSPDETSPAPAPEETAPAPAPAPSPEPSRAPIDPETPPPTPTPTPTEPATPTPPPPTPQPLRVSAPADGELLTGALRASGTATPGSTVQVLAGGSAEPLCISTVDGDGAWACAAEGLESSASTPVRVVEQRADGTSESATVSVRVLTAPLVTGGAQGGSLSNGVVRGTAFPGASVSALASPGGFACTSTADGSGAWSCPLEGAVVDGDYTVQAVQRTAWSGNDSPSSPGVGLSIDVSVPAAPVLSAPAAGAPVAPAGAVFRGTGEGGAAVSVFAGAQVLCQATVASDGRWSCTADAVQPGRYSVAVLQQDAAGNVSVQSGPLTLEFGTGSASPSAPGSPPATAPATPSAPSSPNDPAPPSAPGAPAPGSAPGSGSPDSPGDGDGGQGDGDDSSNPGAPDSGGLTVPAPPGSEGTWTDATRFSATLHPAIGSAAPGTWIIALALGALALLLIALPSRLLATTVSSLAVREGGSGLRGRLAALLGRNHLKHEFDRAPEMRVGPVASTAATLLASAAIVALSGPVLGQPAYLRLYLAVVLALALVTVAATVVPGAVARRVFGIRSRVRLRPGLLIVTAALALVSRLAELEPALVFGLVAGLVVAESASRGARGRLATVQVLALLTLGGIGWVLTGLAAGAGVEGVWAAALSEFGNVVVLASFGASSVLLMPVAGTGGRHILRWSPVTWVTLTLASFAALAMLFVPALLRAGEGDGLLAPALLAVGFAAVCVSAWAWNRFVAAEED